MRKGFTLVEVNLAIFIMAVGVLSMCGLYALGYRENRQSVEDVASVAFADAYLAPLVQGLSSMDMTWSKWCDIGTRQGSNRPDSSMASADGVLPGSDGEGFGWMRYVRKVRIDNDNYTYRIINSPRATADGVFNSIKSVLSSCSISVATPSVPNDFEYALVVTRRGSVIQLAFRCARRRDSLLSQPAVVAEVRFQGDPNK